MNRRERHPRFTWLLFSASPRFCVRISVRPCTRFPAKRYYVLLTDQRGVDAEKRLRTQKATSTLDAALLPLALPQPL
jgi:hypothetical protein